MAAAAGHDGTGWVLRVDRQIESPMRDVMDIGSEVEKLSCGLWNLVLTSACLWPIQYKAQSVLDCCKS